MTTPDRGTSIPVDYATGAIDSELPIRNAAAAAFRTSDGRVLLARRNSDRVEEFKGVWSLPSVFVSAGRDPGVVLSEKLEEWFDVRPDRIRLVRRRMALRPNWRLLMHLYECSVASPEGFQLRTDKYDDLRCFDERTVFGNADRSKLGDCAESFVTHLESIGIR